MRFATWIDIEFVPAVLLSVSMFVFDDIVISSVGSSLDGLLVSEIMYGDLCFYFGLGFEIVLHMAGSETTQHTNGLSLNHNGCLAIGTAK